MLLTVDVGNSQTVLATFDGERRGGQGHHRPGPLPTSLRMLWRGLIRDTEITGVAARSTVPAALAREPLDSSRWPVVLIGPGAHQRAAARRQPA